jgi:hypothetical protein
MKALQPFKMLDTAQPTTVSHHTKPESLQQASSVTMKCVYPTYKIEGSDVSGVNILSSHGLLYVGVQP